MVSTELSVGLQTEGLDVRSVGNTQVKIIFKSDITCD